MTDVPPRRRRARAVVERTVARLPRPGGTAPLASTGKERGVALAIGLFALVSGLIPTLSALNVIPTPDSDFGAPRWIVLLLVQPFVLIGLGITLHSLGMPARVFHTLGFAGGLVFVTAGSIGWTWLLVFGDVGDSAMIGIGPIAVPLPSFVARPLNRVMVVLAAVLTIAIAVGMWFSAIRSWLAAREEDVT